MSKKLVAGFAFWGVLARREDQTLVETPDGLRGERAEFVTELLTRGHTVVQLQKRMEEQPFSISTGSRTLDMATMAAELGLPDLAVALPAAEASFTIDDRTFVQENADGFPDLDLLICEWRWKRLGKSTEDWDRQCALLDHYSAKGTPIIVQDTDLKIRPEDERRWPSMIIGDPCIDPVFLTRKRVKMPFCGSIERDPTIPSVDSPVNYAYVGNNYERDEQFERYYSNPAAALRGQGIQTIVYGNWLTRSVERMHPRAVLQAYPNVAFAPRVAYRDALSTLAKSVATCHITKPEYARHGNVTMRYFEALRANVPALVPIESKHTRYLGQHVGLCVQSASDVVAACMRLAACSGDDRDQIVEMQRDAMRGFGDLTPGNKVDLIEAAACGDLRVS